jgi:SAM-dependent methyltransferase
METFRKEFQYSEGDEALQQVDKFYSKGQAAELMRFFGSHHMLRKLVEKSHAVVTHLSYASDILLKQYNAEHVYTMYLGSPDPFEDLQDADKSSLRKELDIPQDAFVIGTFGHLQRTKQISVSLRALARIKLKYPKVILALVGEINPSEGYDQYLHRLIDDLGVQDNLRLTGFVSKEVFLKYIVASDVQVGLRYPSFMQMSAAVSRGIAAGKSIIITDLPEWEFFSEDFCWRVPAEDTEGAKLEDLIIQLIENPELVEVRGHNAREFYLEEGTTIRSAENLSKIIKQVIETIPTREIESDEFVDIFPRLSERVNSAFELLDSTRAGGFKRNFFNRIRTIPIIGGAVYTIYRTIESLVNIQQVRHAEWNFYNALNESISSFEPYKELLVSSQEDFHKTIRMTKNELNRDFSKIHEDFNNNLITAKRELRDDIRKSQENSDEVINNVQDDLRANIKDVYDDLLNIIRHSQENTLLRAGEEDDNILLAIRDDIRNSKENTDRIINTAIGDLQSIQDLLVTEQSLPETRILEAPLERKTIDAIKITKEFLRGSPVENPEEEFYITFEQVFRGHEDIVKNRQKKILSYLNIPESNKDRIVVDIGCGRGEFLALLKENGIQGVGVEPNNLLVERAVKLGLDVQNSDGLDYMREIQNGMLAGITAFHVIEHLDHSYLKELLETSFEKLADGGFIYLETPNPFCLESLSRFYTDPTHLHPIQPFQLTFLLEYHGFSDPKLIFQEPIPARGSLAEERWIQFYQDYGILATK